MTSSVSFYVCDDESHARNRLVRLIEQDGRFKCAGQFQTGDDLLAHHTDHSAELVFLDIEMPGRNGIDIASQLEQRLKVIFTTAYPEYAARAFEIQAENYLVKPVHRERLKQALDNYWAKTRAKSRHGTQEADEPYIHIRYDRSDVRLKQSDIVHVEAEGDYIRINTDQSEYFVRGTMKAFLEKCEGSSIIRCHKTHAINLSRAFQIKDSLVSLKRKTTPKAISVPIGNRFRKELLKRFNDMSNLPKD